MPLFRLPDGRDLEYEVSGPSIGHAVVFHHGMPGSAVPMPTVLDSITERGFRVITYSRAGYGASSPAPGRSVADSAADCVSLLAYLGIAKYLTVGWSTGGPHALAQAALAPESVTGVLSVASFAPFDAPGLDFVEGMGAQNVAQFSITGQGEQAVRGLVTQMAAAVRNNSPADVVASLASLFSPVDAEVLVGRFGAENAANMNHALASSDEGWVADLMALTSPWGVDITAIKAKVELWHGFEDRMVPLSHGQWLAGHLPTVTPHLQADHGHLSIAIGSLGDKLDALTYTHAVTARDHRPGPGRSDRR
ncbi:alpha/beta hydrolase [Kibdelosporangium aridum]|uniref:Alpha/beta hydrolase n=1 Tax=Kibdelosporangium aridum TaxID=2030 RepID=A0A428ZHY3_KIBAR|nr:alpha/beta fold hydrolase [Kibdelosporangium aridum]RSM87570.1 alpha/beta hydrolase [Kibdelosporangium aridum]